MSGRSSHGLHPLQGFPSINDGQRFHVTSPHALCALPTRGYEEPNAPGCQSRMAQLDSFETADPPEVLVLVSPLAALDFRVAGLMVLPWTPSDVSASVSLSLASLPSSRGAASGEFRT